MSQSTILAISPRELEALKKTGKTLDLIDVRTPVEYRAVHAEGARNIPLDRLNPAEVGREKSGADNVYVICQSGTRARSACEKFHAAGFVNVKVVDGGTKAWEEAGLPVVRGKKAVSLERQVRIAAGTLILTGVVLGTLVHPYLIGLSAFVGAGLLFSGITDTCGMGLLLTRMPWNQVGDEPKTQCQLPSKPVNA